MPLILVRKSLALEEQAHIEIKFITRSVVLIEVPGDGRIIDPLGEQDINFFILLIETMTGAVFRIAENGTVQQSDRPIRKIIFVIIRENERHFPVVAQVANTEGRSMHL